MYHSMLLLGPFQLCFINSLESNGKLLDLFKFIPSKTANFVPEFAVEDLPLGRTAALVLSLQGETCTWAEHSDDDCLLIFCLDTYEIQ